MNPERMDTLPGATIGAQYESDTNTSPTDTSSTHCTLTPKNTKISETPGDMSKLSFI